MRLIDSGRFSTTICCQTTSAPKLTIWRLKKNTICLSWTKKQRWTSTTDWRVTPRSTTMWWTWIYTSILAPNTATASSNTSRSTTNLNISIRTTCNSWLVTECQTASLNHLAASTSSFTRLTRSGCALILEPINSQSLLVASPMPILSSQLSTVWIKN